MGDEERALVAPRRTPTMDKRRVDTFAIPLGERDRGYLHGALGLLGLEHAYRVRPSPAPRGGGPERERYLAVPRRVGGRTQAGFGAAGEWLAGDPHIGERGGEADLHVACYGERDRPGRLPTAVVGFVHRLRRAHAAAEVNAALERLLAEDGGPEGGSGQPR